MLLGLTHLFKNMLSFSLMRRKTRMANEVQGCSCANNNNGIIVMAIYYWQITMNSVAVSFEKLLLLWFLLTFYCQKIGLMDWCTIISISRRRGKEFTMNTKSNNILLGDWFSRALCAEDCRIYKYCPFRKYLEIVLWFVLKFH